MPDTTILREIEIDAPAARVWPYIATEEGLRQWWGGAIALEPYEGGRCVERTVLQGRPREQVGVVTVYQPPRRLTLAFRPSDADAPEALLSHISITLVEEAGRTRVTVSHRVTVPAAEPVAAPRLPALAPVRTGPRMGLEVPRPSLGPGAPVPAAGTDSPGAALRHRWDMRLAQLRQAVDSQSVLEGNQSYE